MGAAENTGAVWRAGLEAVRLLWIVEGLILRREAAVYRYALIGGMVESLEVVAWADAWIGRLDECPDAVVGVSMGTSREYDLFASLAELAEKPVSDEALRLLCRMMSTFLEKHPKKLETVTHLLARLALDRAVPEEWSSEALRFDDARWLAEDGIFDVKAVQDEVLAFLHLHGS